VDRHFSRFADNRGVIAPHELRLFLALWPAPATLVELQQHADKWIWPAQARRTRSERLHVTLHFIGNVPDSQVLHLCKGLAVSWPGDTLVLDRPTVWRGGIAVLEAAAVPPALAALHEELGRRLHALDLPVETRPYRPHVTLARKAVGAEPPASARVVWQAGPRFALVRTVGGGRGYETLQCFG
jgi:2'-5' RNA ligase